ncbi:MAG: D-alanyl-lipoteichoic acid biosynthesis protein DltD [Lactobacillus sp.]|nr:D-alanyl-lipoteichoic acid biosynthesis protein DltD [Lactobacillus sp.]
MTNKQRLWHIFGPVICAIVLVLGILQIPWDRTFSKESIFQAANSQSTTIFKGVQMKRDAFAYGYVPFYGSSELSRFDALHPSVLAYKYHRKYKPFLLGGPGSQSLAQFIGMQGTESQLKNKKAVMIISPQWFTKQGQNPMAFQLYYSPLETILFALNAKNTVADRYAAKRLLTMPSVRGSIKDALVSVSKGQKINSFTKFVIKRKLAMLSSEDNFFSAWQLRDRIDLIKRKAKELPTPYSAAKLDRLGFKLGKKHTTSNKFGINNRFYRTRFTKSILKKLKGSQKKFDYVKSPEYGDFELVLTKFASQGTNVQFVIPPVNHKWAKYTGLSMKMYETSVAKIKRQLTTQGFTNVLDLSHYGKKKYFMEDTIHIGWRGWAKMDQTIRAFMKQPNKAQHYKLSNYYFTKKWANKRNVSMPFYENKKNIKDKQLVAKLKKTGFNGEFYIVKNGKFLGEFSSQKTFSNMYLVNSVQKSMTAAMVMKQIQNKKLSLSTKLAKFYPNIPGSNKVTINNLLNMTSGLVIKSVDTNYSSDAKTIEFDANHTKFNSKLYGKWNYTSLNYVLLSGILSKLTHKSYEKLFTQTFIDRLNLKNTEFLWNLNQNDNFQAGSEFGNKVSLKTAILAAHNDLGAGSVVMSSADLAKVEKDILSGSWLSDKTRSQIFLDNATYSAGLYNEGLFRSANGAGSGFYTFLRISPDGKTVLVAQTNSVQAGFSTLKLQMDGIIKYLLK